MKFKLHNIRESKAWQELRAEGEKEGRLGEREQTVRKCLAKGMTENQIAELLDINVVDIRRLANGHAAKQETESK